MNSLRGLSVLFIFLPVAALVLSNILTGSKRRNQRRVIIAAVSVIQSLLSVYFFIWMTMEKIESYPFSLSHPGRSYSAYFALNRPGLVIMFVEGLVCLTCIMVASQTITEHTNSYTNLLMILMLAMTCICVSENLFSLYVFMEIVGIASFIMIAIYREDTGLEGAFKYLVMSCLAGAAILTGCAFVFMLNGSLQFSDLNISSLIAAKKDDQILLALAAVLFLSGFAIKAGLAPFHNWLPDAYQSADASVSIVLSGAINKAAGIYGIITVMNIFGVLPGIHEALAVLGLFSIAAGALLALRQNNFKRIAAYSSVSQMGYIVLGIAAGTTLGLIGAVAHVLSHSIFKSTLFTNAAAINRQTGTLDTDKMGGLENQMPVTAFTSVIAFLSTAGIPPLCGFWSKFTIVLALYMADMKAAAVLALIFSIFTSCYFLRLQRKVFFGKSLAGFKDVKEVNGGILAAEVMLTILTVVIGIMYPFILRFLGLN